jgi:hypothetical protein
MDAEWEDRGDGFRLAVHAERDGRFVESLRLSARIVPPKGEAFTVDLPQAAPGEYAAVVPGGQAGSWHATVFDAAQGTVLHSSAARNYAREWETFGVDRAALSAIANAGGGEALESLADMDDVPPRTAGAYAPLDWLLALAALVVFVLGVFLSVLRVRRAPV